MEKVWQIVIIMVVGTFCIGALAKLVSGSILDEVDKFREKSTVRTMKSLTVIFNGLNEALNKVIESQNKRREEFDKNENAMRTALEEMKRTLNKS